MYLSSKLPVRKVMDLKTAATGETKRGTYYENRNPVITIIVFQFAYYKTLRFLEKNTVGNSSFIIHPRIHQALIIHPRICSERMSMVPIEAEAQIRKCIFLCKIALSSDFVRVSFLY